LLARADTVKGKPYEVFSENDDSAMHIGLTQSKLDALGIDDRLIIMELRNHSIENLIVRMNYTAVPELVSSAMVQADYAFTMLHLDITPAVRYMYQFDNGAGAIGGATLKGPLFTKGYRDPESLDSWLVGARVDIANDAWRVRLGYTQVADKADIIAPWRGFPTSGFSRAMAQYNWYANTKSYMLRADYDFDSAGLIPGVQAFMRFVIQDFDDEKIATQADSTVVTVDVLKEFESYPDLYVKLRMAHVVSDKDTMVEIKGNRVPKANKSYDEVRFEINYLF